MKIENVLLTAITSDPANVRRHDARNVEAIRASLARFGQRKPIVINADGVVIAGNGTLEAARALGWEAIEAVRFDDLTGVEAAAFAIADNRTAELAEWDYQALSATMRAIRDEDPTALAAIGFAEHEIGPLLAAQWGAGDADPNDLDGMSAAGAGTALGTQGCVVTFTAEQWEVLEPALGEGSHAARICALVLGGAA